MYDSKNIEIEKEELKYEVLKIFFKNCYIKHYYYIPVTLLCCIFIIFLGIHNIISNSIANVGVAGSIISVIYFFYVEIFIHDKPIDEQYLKKVNKDIEERFLHNNKIQLNQNNNDIYRENINDVIKEILKIKGDKEITYDHIINMFKRYKKQFDDISEKKLQKEKSNKQFDLINKYFVSYECNHHPK